MPQGRRKVVEEAPGKAEVERAKLWLSTKDTSILDFMQSYKIPTKRPGRFGGRTMIPFKAYPSQVSMLATVEEQWARGEGGKEFMGKGRQDGATTFCDLFFWERFMRGGGGTWNIFSYDTDATKESFRLLQSFRRQTDEWIFTSLLHGGGEWRRDSAMQMEIVFADGTVSMLQCLTAGDKRSGSGSAPRGVLMDEGTKWDPDVKRDMSSMTEGWADEPGNLHLMPFTGQGKEEFAEMFLSAWNGEDSGGYVAKFFPWLGHPDRRLEFKSESEKRAFAARVGKDRQYGIADETALTAAGATMEELHWRRRKIPTPGFQWDLSVFRREYPLIVTDMFSSSTRTIFHAAEDVLKSHKVPAMLRERAAKKGGLEWKGKGVVFVEDPAGSWTVFEEPREDLVYCFGADATSGKQTTKGKDGQEPDFALGDFAEVLSGRQVAYCRAHWEGSVFAEELFKCACWFKGRHDRGAEGFVERNTWGAAVIKAFGGLKCGDIYGEDVLLMEDDEDTRIAPFHAAKAAHFGFDTHQQSKEVLIDVIRGWLLEVGVFVPDPVNPDATPMSSQFVTEAMLYERNPKNGRAEARIGHDDTVIARGLNRLAAKKIVETGGVELESKVNPRKPESPQRRALREMDEKAAKEYVEVYGNQEDASWQARVRSQ